MKRRRRGRSAQITASHLSRQAFVYLRQSSAAQVENNRESTDRQYALAAKARELGWPADRIVVIDEDLGLSGLRARLNGGIRNKAARGELRRGLWTQLLLSVRPPHLHLTASLYCGVHDSRAVVAVAAMHAHRAVRTGP